MGGERTMNTATAGIGLEKDKLIERRLYTLLCEEAEAIQSRTKQLLEIVSRPHLRCDERSQVNELFEAQQTAALQLQGPHLQKRPAFAQSSWREPP